MRGIVAINQIGIAANLIDILFVGLVAALALAFGLAFGLGGRDVAARVAEGWYESARSAGEKVRMPTEETTARADAPEPARAPQPRVVDAERAREQRRGRTELSRGS